MSSNRKSRIPFCDSLPSDWDEIPNRYIFYRHSRKVGDKSNCYQLLSLTTQGVKQKDINAAGGKVPKNYDNYQTVEKNDMIFCLFDLDCSAVFSGLSKYDGMITSAYNVFGVNNDYADNSYLNYWFQFVFSNRYYKMFSKSIRYTVTEDNFKMQYTPIPPIVEQVKIGEYLDGKIKKIDTLIANQQQQIGKLKQYKQSLITEVVTKGLDRNVAMKESGVDWIGEVPKEWKLEKIKYVAIIRDEKYEGGDYEYIALENVESLSGRYVKTDSTYDLEGTKLAYSGDVIFGKLRPYLGKALSIDYECCVSTEFAVFSPKKLASEYLKYVLLSSGFIEIINASTYGTKMPRANVDFIKNVIVPIPTKKEQDDIVAEAIRIDNSLQRLIDIKLSKIEKLNQYKKSLIYEYVTGKKRVPEA